jgi:acetoin utilization deacetylase AcuC-like enzyme
MGCTLHVAWDDRLAGYDFGAGHPMAPVRVELTIELARAFGLFSEPGVSVEPPAPATDEDLETVHHQGYIAAVRHAGGPVPAGLAQSREAGDLWNQVGLLPKMATLDLRAGRTEDAAEHLREALQIAARTGAKGDALDGLDRCGYLCAATGRRAEALTVGRVRRALPA